VAPSKAAQSLHVAKPSTVHQLAALQGVFCGDCLFMRYGENVDEVNANPGWTCPHCRDPLLCNCSQHRTRRGWAPTGALYRKAIAMGAPPPRQHS
jgi:Zinc-finger domain of monoamine-oxidase A repressor R1